ncbi:MAG: hypothetical protein C4581_09245 [Nitrospiraceae bacterium]|nr:MAG: hypothetical protein C4581_09245 [Nitrospiraceae bacterium]
MLSGTSIERDHPLRKLFRNAIAFGLQHNPIDKIEVADYIEEQILCEFIHTDSLYRIRDEEGTRLEDMADILAEGNVLLNAKSFEQEFQVHKHIGDYTLFMLGMFPMVVARRRGREFVLGHLVVPGASLSEHYMLQGRRSYRIASELTHGDIFEELSLNFSLYKNILELVRIYIESENNSALIGDN